MVTGGQVESPEDGGGAEADRRLEDVEPLRGEGREGRPGQAAAT